MKNTSTRTITGVAILLAIEIIFQVIGNFVAFPGGINLNLALIPIAIGAIVYGPLAGAFIGFMNGLLVLFSPSTQSFFMVNAPLGTVITCLSKGILAGLISGFVYKAISKKNTSIGSIVASLLVPIINTGIFALCAFTVLLPAIRANNSNSESLWKFIFLTLIGFNFIFEFLVTAVLTPAITKIMKIMTRSDKHAL